jgi:hypothetical protein
MAKIALETSFGYANRAVFVGKEREQLNQMRTCVNELINFYPVNLFYIQKKAKYISLDFRSH